MHNLTDHIQQTNRVYYNRITLENKFGKTAVLQLIESGKATVYNGLNGYVLKCVV